MSPSQHWIATAGQPLRGTLEIPGDKSVSHRSVMLAALADGVSTIDGFLEGEDTRATAAIFARLGVRIETPSPSRRIVRGIVRQTDDACAGCACFVNQSTQSIEMTLVDDAGEVLIL